MSKQNHTAAGGALSLERLVFFSDAVFAIAITLLVLEIHVPRLAGEATDHDFAIELAHLLPSLIAFALSFLVIGMFWMGHHRLFADATHYSEKLVWPNLLFLMAIAFMPFATAFMGSNGDRFVPALVYNSSLLACGLAEWRLAVVVGRLSQDRPANRINTRRAAVTAVAAAICVGLAFLVPQLSQIGMLLTILGGRIARRGISQS